MYKYCNKIDALTIILKRLDNGERTNPEQLGNDFGVSVRTIYRYLNHLQAAGYPIYFDKEERSYRFLNNFRLGKSKPVRGVEQLNLGLDTQSIGMAIATFRTSGECINRNMAMIRLTGCSDERQCCRNFRNLDWWKNSGLLAMAEEAIATNHEVCRDITLNFRGREHWVQAHLTPVQRDNESFLVLLAQDLTPRMYKEMQVARFFNAINHGPGLVLVTDTEGKIEYVGQRSEEVTGYPPSELVGNTPGMLKSGLTPAETYQNLWSTISRGIAWSGELYNRKKNGSCYWQHLHIAPIRNSSDQICRYVALLKDITKQKMLDEELYNYAITDPLTGLYNRKMFLELANRDLASARRFNRPMTLIVTDFDNFKQFNDLYGYPAGNLMLQQLAELCRSFVRNCDLLGRVDKDAFGILLNESNLADSGQVAKRILIRTREICCTENKHGENCTISIAGTALTPMHHTMEALLHECERILKEYQLSEKGNGLVGFV